MTTHEPQRPDLARELIARAALSAAHRAKRVRDQLDAVQLGQGRHTDHANTNILRRILVEHDWPGHRLVGPDAARAAWSIALQSDDDPAFQRAATTLLGRAVHAGDALVQHWAHLYDRALITNGRDQEYGTQLCLRADGIELCPLREPESVDARRFTVGLPPIAVALKAVRHRYTPDAPADAAPTGVLAGGPLHRWKPPMPTGATDIVIAQDFPGPSVVTRPRVVPLPFGLPTAAAMGVPA